MDEDKQTLTDKIMEQEELIAELKLQLTSKEVELEHNNLQYDMLDGDQTIDEGEDGEEAKYGLEGDFNDKDRQNSQIVDGDHSGMPLNDTENNDLSQLNEMGVGDMSSGNPEAEYAEIDASAQNNIFEQDECK